MKSLIFLLLITISFNSNGQGDSDSFIQLITSKVDSMPNGFAISIALLKNGEVNYIGIEKENGLLIVKELEDSLFEIGSLTKVFTSTILAYEVANNNLKLNEAVNKSFPYKFKNKTKLTYQSLANHTSGLPRLPSNIFPLIFKNQQNPYLEYSYELLDQYLKEDLQIESSENINYAYSNLGAGLLAYALSKRSSKSFESLLNEIIFSQYKMENTSFEFKTSYTGLNDKGDAAENWQFNALKGAGGLISSTYDLSKFIVAQFDSTNRILSLTRKPTHTISENMSIGLGWHIISSNDSNLMYWHNGGTGGFTSSISFKTSNQTGVIILSNISALHNKSSAIDELCFELLDLLK